MDNSLQADKRNKVNPVWRTSPWDKARPQHQELRALLSAV